MKYADTTWDFVGADTKQLTHCFHTYPAMMIPQIAERIIMQYGNKSTVLFDPYCGTGTSLVEANRKGINAIGTDLNPLARLIATAKTTMIELQVLDLFLKDFYDYTFSLMFNQQSQSVVIPVIKNIDYWFDKDVQERLSQIALYISKISNPAVADFFRVAFSETIRESSYTRNSEFKLFRMTSEQMQKFNPDVFGMMHNKLARNRKGLCSYLQARTSANSQVYCFDTSKTIDMIHPLSVDIVVTSPPYGDSKTTVAYGQFSRLANEWLGVLNANQIDNELMGGKKRSLTPEFSSSALYEPLQKITAIDKKRGEEVASFYADYRDSIRNVAMTIKNKGYACYVVGNRKVKGIVLPTDEITKNLFEHEGFTHKETIVRNIPNKRMPSKNSPSNISGQKDETMTNEYIVIMKKN